MRESHNPKGPYGAASAASYWMHTSPLQCLHHVSSSVHRQRQGLNALSPRLKLSKTNFSEITNAFFYPLALVLFPQDPKEQMQFPFFLKYKAEFRAVMCISGSLFLSVLFDLGKEKSLGCRQLPLPGALGLGTPWHTLVVPYSWDFLWRTPLCWFLACQLCYLYWWKLFLT